MNLDFLRNEVKTLNDYLNNSSVNVDVVKAFVKSICEIVREKNEKEPLLVKDMYVSTRTINVLLRYTEIRNINQLLNYTYEDLLHIKNLGKKGRKEITDELHRLGYYLKNEKAEETLYSLERE